MWFVEADYAVMYERIIPAYDSSYNIPTYGTSSCKRMVYYVFSMN